MFRGNSTNTEIDPNYISRFAIASPSQNQFGQASKLKSIATSELYFRNNNRNAGIALIFNHVQFKGPNKPRNGAEKDAKDIEKSLKDYGFDCTVHSDKTYNEITEIIKKVSEVDHSYNDCLVVVVMTHGEKGIVSAYDKYYAVEELWTPFLGDSCKTLINKPKLFFIQACRGYGLEEAVIFKDSVGDNEMINKIDKIKQSYVIPSTADLLIMYACYEGKSACRNPLSGSWFIQSLCSKLNENLTNENGVELYHLLTAVIQKVAYELQSFSNVKELHEKKQMPNFTTTLTKLFVLKPKQFGNKRF